MRKDVVEDIIGIGKVYFVNSPKASRLNIRIKQDGEIRVSVPKLSSYESAKSFVLSKRNWINKNVARTKLKRRDYDISPDKALITHFHTFEFIKSPIDKLKVKIEDRIVKVQYPDVLSIDDTNLQDAFRYTYIEVLRKEAKFYLPNRVKLLAEKFGFKYNDLRIKNIKSRWGSCSSLNNINLSLHIMKLPFELIDFIILHELTHTIHKNHGPGFHKYLEGVCPKAKAFDKEVKNYGIFKV